MEDTFIKSDVIVYDFDFMGRIILNYL